ncbi:MAG: ClbS/DfsB family four-helix bundle protein [Pyrinomonadaceae bacterium]|nr:ClbS/DfsB family four-helix bundle protein [Pyrinomonadaceae bacterium]
MIPKTRKELMEQLVPSWQKLDKELSDAGPEIGDLPCVDDWTVKDLLAVRVWWTGSVIDWVEAWRRGEKPVLPKEGYLWQETPRLNNDIVAESQKDSYSGTVNRLKVNYYRILSTVNAMDDAELIDVGFHKQAGSYSVCRWISINTTRQYMTARTYIRKAIRASGIED